MKPIERFVIVVSALIIFLLASAGITAIYWTLGGSLKWGAGLAAYAGVELYLAYLVVVVARNRP